MAYKTCPDCGSRVFNRGCVNCDKDNYIAEQEYFNHLPEIYDNIEADIELPKAETVKGRMVE